MAWFVKVRRIGRDGESRTKAAAVVLRPPTRRIAAPALAATNKFGEVAVASKRQWGNKKEIVWMVQQQQQQQQPPQQQPPPTTLIVHGHPNLWLIFLVRIADVTATDDVIVSLDRSGCTNKVRLIADTWLACVRKRFSVVCSLFPKCRRSMHSFSKWPPLSFLSWW